MTRFNKTKVVATIGPASAEPAMLAAMIKSGADVMRINGAHGSAREHIKTIRMIRVTAKKLRAPIAILVDLPGPKFRVGVLLKEPVKLETGQVISLVCGKTHQIDEKIPIPNKIHTVVKSGDTVFINDGAVELRAIKIKGPVIECRVVAGGEVLSHKGINLPGTKLRAPALTRQDLKILRMVMSEGVDYVALSFVRNASNINTLRKILRRKAPHIGIIAKIEKPEALEDIDNIIDASDAIMVARGDLGIEVPYYRLPVIQREILHKCLIAGKPSIIATQMLESMIHANKPTRAEATDVAGAVWEGSDAVMLSAETSVGKNPDLAVLAMSQIAAEAEGDLPHFSCPEFEGSDDILQACALCKAAVFVAESLKAKAIVTPSRSGRTPLFVSRERPNVMILAPTENENIARKMALYWGVMPMALPTFKTVDELMKHAETAALKSSFIKHGDKIVITSGAHSRKGDITRLLEVRRV